MIDVVSLGECMALVYPDQPVGLAVASGLRLDMAGAESNLCIGLSRLGIQTRFISRLGNDPFGARLRGLLESESVATDALVLDADAPSGLFFRENLADGQRRVYYYRRGSAASRLCPEDLKPEWFEGTRVLHLTGITPALSATCEAACHRAVELARLAGALISFDPNYRPKLWGKEAARAALLPLMRQADILLMGHEDADAILGAGDVDQALRMGADLGASQVVLKRAEQGASALVNGKRIDAPVFPAAQVVDPVGAGDGFNAGFLAGWLRGWETEASLGLGARVGSAAVEVMGDYAGYPRGI